MRLIVGLVAILFLRPILYLLKGLCDMIPLK